MNAIKARVPQTYVPARALDEKSLALCQTFVSHEPGSREVLAHLPMNKEVRLIEPVTMRFFDGGSVTLEGRVTLTRRGSPASCGEVEMAVESLSIAQQAVVFSYSLREDGLYCRPRDSELRDEFGGRMISSSNDGESIISFSPTDVWEFPDGSRVEIGCSIAEVIAGAALAVVREGDQTIGVWSIETAPTPFLRDLVKQAVENGEATAQDDEGCTVTAVLVGQ